MPPKISVVLPVFNGSAYLAEALASVLAQTEGDFELLAVDDGSQDGSLQLLRKFARQDQRIQVLSQDHAGVTQALNLGVQAARGELIARMDADDVALPQRFWRQAEFLDNHPRVLAVGSFVQRIDSEGLPIAVGKWPTDHDEIDAQLMQGRGGLPHPAAMIRRDALLRIGSYREEFPVAQDKDLWLRLAEIGQLANIPEPLLRYREHVRSVSSVRQAEQVAAVRRAVEEAARRRNTTVAWRQDATAATKSITEFDRRRQWVNAAVRHGNLPTAIKHALILMRQRPTSWRTWLTLLRLTRRPMALALALSGRPSPGQGGSGRPWFEHHADHLHADHRHAARDEMLALREEKAA